MANTIVLAKLPPKTVTAYVSGARTRSPGGQIPHLGTCLTIDRAPSSNWVASPATVKAWGALNEELAADGHEPLRLVDAWRAPGYQQHARTLYDNWLAAGRPDPGVPGSGFDSRIMKAAYVARPNGSNHQWGGSFDFDVGAIKMKGVRERGSDEALSCLWEYLDQHGFRPIIAHPVADQNEAWHVDHLGPLQAIYDLFRAETRSAYTETALIGCALAGTLANRTTNISARYMQARLAIGGEFPGTADGIPGRKTIAALKRAGCPKVVAERAKKSTDQVISWMNESQWGVEAIAAL